jgi:DNA-binding IclR family transcriptional regulator
MRVCSVYATGLQGGQHTVTGRSHGDLYPGAFSVATPVRDHGGRVVASLSVAGSQSRLTRDLESLYIRTLIEAAGEISAKLGGTRRWRCRSLFSWN